MNTAMLGVWMHVLALGEVIVTAEAPKAKAQFGNSLDLRGNIALIGAQEDFNVGFGQAVIIEALDGDWTTLEYTSLVQPMPTLHYFGRDVALGNGCAFVSAVPDLKTPDELGKVYAFVFDMNNDAWEHAQTFPAPTLGDAYGNAIDISDDCLTLVIGNNNHTVKGLLGAGNVEVYQSDEFPSPWDFVKALEEPDPGTKHRFGYSVAITSTGNGIAVGSPYELQGDGPARAYVFRRSGDDWPLVGNGLNGTAKTADGFGEGVALSDDGLLAATAFYEDGTGAAYVCPDAFNDDAICTKLAPHDDLTVSDSLGAVAIDGDLIVIGSVLGEKMGNGTGVAFRYFPQGPTWVVSPEVLYADMAKLQDGFGTAVAVSGDAVLIGAPGVDPGAVGEAGAAYVYRLKHLGAPCTTGDECRTGYCVDEVCCDGACGGGDPNDAMACNDDGMCVTAGDTTGTDTDATDTGATSGTDGTTSLDTSGDTSTAGGPGTTNDSLTAPTSGGSDPTGGDATSETSDTGELLPPSVSFCDCDARGAGDLGAYLLTLSLLPLLRRRRAPAKAR